MRSSVSVVIPAWNAADYLKGSVKSALRQDEVEVEVIVVDDRSMDDTFGLAQRIADRDPRVKVLQTRRNGGAPAARNLGLAHATGDWYAVLDADDSFAPGRLKRLVEFAQTRHLDIAFDNLRLVDPDGTPFRDPVFWPREHFDGDDLWTLAYFARNNRPYRSPRLIGFLKPVISMEFLRQRGVRYDPRLSNSQDYMLILEALFRRARAAAMPAAGYNYAIRPDSVSGTATSAEKQQPLIDAEERFLEKFGPRMRKSDREALTEHLYCLKLALQSELVFGAIRRRDPLSLVSALRYPPGDMPVQIGRVAKAAARRVRGIRPMRGR